ncbi:O-antigen polymerase [Desulfofarcimen acetoxidans DSM 771]|uniref:O-antigen polymerase n=1 Tax=Desulfofarcimen acetoxidans (strain ATCC 49208 / DSM 771 / KCTC 5769 / VKM B-1644 / 5575) TaxID=485916 RepID=C8VYU2_DESAS|nr:O-antigen ligase family protein [Desulfofarcimen acetoxidans]ACV64813.1 O-antigen polymerase [Desulfofarcimen acetoxidans DSM 771]
MAKKSEKRKFQKETGANVQNKENGASLTGMVILAGLSMLLFFSPFSRGLFFATEQKTALLLALLIFLVVCIGKLIRKETKIFYHPMDYFLLALPVVYIIATFNAVNYNLSINEIVKNLLYFLVYWTVVQSIQNERDRSLILHAIYFAALGTALAGLAAGIGLIDIQDGIALAPKVWISSSFQYHNAFASYLGAALFLGLYFWNKTRSTRDEPVLSSKLAFLPGWFVRLNPQLIFYTKINFLILTVFWAAKSRGGILFFAAVLLLYLVVLGKDRVAAAVYMLLMSVPAYIAAEKFLSCMVAHQMISAVLWVATGVILAVAGQLLFILYDRQIGQLGLADEKNQKYFFALIALLAVAGGLFLAHYSNVENRVLSFSYLRNALERMYFVDDAVKMIKERPLLGWGGGGWEEAYRSFQEYLYNSTQVHCYYVQVAVETGIMGILTLLGIVGSFIILVYNLYCEHKENKTKLQVVFTLAAAVLFIAGHAAMDFNLSLSALTMVLSTFLGILVGMWRLSPQTVERNPIDNKAGSAGCLYIAVIMAVIIFAADSSLILSDKYAKSANERFSAKDATNGVMYLQQAVESNPFNPANNYALAQIYSSSGLKDQAIAEAKKVLELSKYDPTKYVNISRLYYGLGDKEKAAEFAEKAVELAPYRIEMYDNLVELYYTLGYNEISNQNKEAAAERFKKVIDISMEIQNRVDRLTDYQKKMWKDGPMLALTTNMASKTGAARYFLGQYKEAEENLNFAATDENLKSEVLLWQALVAEKLGYPEKAQEFLRVGEKDNEKIREQFSGLSSISLK